MPSRFTPETYDHYAQAQRAWGSRIAEHLPAAEPRLALDAGCGTGQSTRLLLDRYPTTRVVAIDKDLPMARHSCISLRQAGYGGRINALVADLQIGPFTAPRTFDVVFSVAALHWITDQSALWRNLADMLAPGGTVCAEYAGFGNLAAVVAVVGHRLPGRVYAGPEETRRTLEGAGLVPEHVALRPDPWRFTGPDDVREALEKLVLHEYPAELVDQIATSLAEPVLDWVRLEVVARRPAGR